MSGYNIAIATEKPKTFYIVVKILEQLDLKFRTCAPGEPFCDVAKVVITTRDEATKIDPQRLVIVDDVPDETTAIFDIMTRYLSVGTPREVIVGIDPGLHIGVVVLADGITIYSRVMASTVDACYEAIELAQLSRIRYPHASTIVRVGLGSKLYSTLMLRTLVQDSPDCSIELVDERYTTSPGGYMTDQTSALLIAGRIGRKPEKEDFLLEPKIGFIRALQHLFSWLTNNRGELSIETARRILADEITVAEALSEFFHLEKNRSNV
ncbi:MAG: hypothetical protein P1Q69_02825 [Candidatus Thorarchaeota archaeon]|nr:hypothetical protein [Candidatus Thorarchaeota archaeon]